jgi:flagellar hook-associated protein 2
MAVSSTSSSAGGGGSVASIDVAAVVEQLMTIEKKPLDTLTGAINKQKLVISDLGVIKSKVAVFQDALNDFENANSYNTVDVSYTDKSVLSATGSSGALLGNFSVTVSSRASADTWTISGFTATDNAVTVDGSGFAITVAGTSYNSKTPPTGVSALTESPTVTDLANWINSLDAEVAASVIQTSGSNYVLQIYGTKTGTDNAVSFTGLTNPVGGSSTQSTTSGNATVTVNGTSFTRSSNTISDIVDGVTFKLISTSATAQTVSVTRGSDNSKEVITKMIDSFNDLINTYKSMTANSYNSDKPGTFASDPTTLAFINEIKGRFAKGVTYGSAMTNSISMSSMGIDFLIDGALKFNELTFMDAQNAGLQDKLAQGVTIGYVSSTNNLKEYINDLIGLTGSGGSLTEVITTEKEQINALYKRQTLLQDKLDKVQSNLVNQYSALNSLLYQLSVTSNSLTSALDALSNNNKS